MDVGTLADLSRYMEWADSTVWSAVLGAEAARRDARIREWLYHVHMVQRAFLRVWRGEPREAPYPTFDDTAPMLDWARAGHAEVGAHLASLSDRDVAGAMPVAWVDLVEQHLGRKPGLTVLGETVLQVVLHTQHHRGQVVARLRDLGAVPPMVDYIAWLWLGRPAPAWPSGEAGEGTRA